MSAENTEPLPFVSLKLCFLGFVHRHNELFFILSLQLFSIVAMAALANDVLEAVL